jgi:branched-chain amino acid transport system substrate-binding protein
VFRVCGRNDDQGCRRAAYAVEHFKGKRIAIVDDKSTFGKGVADQFRKSSERARASRK